jgi:hypothetical protein
MTYHSDPVPFWCPLDPALCQAQALGFWPTSAERYGRAFWALTVSKANY